MKIAVLKGDGIGIEVVNQALKVLDKISSKYNLKLETKEALIGGAAIDKFASPLPQETIDICLNSDAVLLGAVGGPKWDKNPPNLRPEAGLLSIRKLLGVYANLRPAILFKELKSASNLKESLLENGIDIMIVRELIGGIYFGKRDRLFTPGGEQAYDTLSYCDYEIRRVAEIAFQVSRNRNKRVTLVDKANVLESSRLWRDVVKDVHAKYSDVTLDFMYVDNAAMQLIKNPNQFDVILTENMFGDILSDEASMLTGSLGMLPSASIGDGKIGLYEPIHGSAPDIKGQDKANPIGTIMSIAMMLRHSFKLENCALDIENSVEKVLKDGYRTLDIFSEGSVLVGTEKMGDLIASNI